MQLSNSDQNQQISLDWWRSHSCVFSFVATHSPDPNSFSLGFHTTNCSFVETRTFAQCCPGSTSSSHGCSEQDVLRWKQPIFASSTNAYRGWKATTSNHQS